MTAAAAAGLWHLREINRRNAVAVRACTEAQSLLHFLIHDTSQRLRGAGRGKRDSRHAA